MSNAIAYTSILYVVVAILLAVTAFIFTPRFIRAEQAAANRAIG
jgi:hypothetical protein